MDVGAVLNVTDPKTENQGPPTTSLGGPSHDASQASHGGLMKEWNSWLEQPGNQAALVTAGLNMMQPIGVGQSVLGHIARAVGKGGEAKQEMQQTAVKQDLEKSQADYYASGGSRANASGLTAGQILSQEDRTKAAYSKVFLEALQSLDPVDPLAALQELRQDPEKYQQFLEGVNVLFQQSRNVSEAPTLATQVPGVSKIKIDTQGRKWHLQNNQWVQVK